MNKLSANTDQVASSLPPKVFPNLSNFKLSGSSVSSVSSRAPFPDYSNVKFLPNEKPIPNLFQYNDREKLILSSDQQQEHEPSFAFQPRVQLTSKKEDLKSDNNQTIKKSKAGALKQKNEEKQSAIQAKQIKLFQPQNKKADSQKIGVMEQKKQQPKEQIILAKVYNIKGQGYGKTKNIPKGNLQISKPDKYALPQKKVYYPQYQNNEKAYNKMQQDEILPPAKDLDIEQMNKVQQQTTNKKQNIQQTPKHEMTVIQEEQSNSNTQQILQNLQSDKHTIVAPSQSERRLDTIHSQYDVENLTPRKRKRNKIFDKSSIRRQPSYLLGSQKGLTPEKGVQTSQRQQKAVQSEETSNDLFPQIKALNILDKLVDQIQYQRIKPRTFHQQQHNRIIVAEINDFNKLLVSQIITFQNISHISELTHFAERMHILKQKILKWDEKIAKYQSLILSHQAFLKFNRLNELCLTIFMVYNKYKETIERLQFLQRKLEDYVMILRTKDAKRLYLLRRQLNVQMQLLYQLRAGCRETKYEKLFSQYLSNEIQLLGQIKDDIDGNFNNQLPILKF